MHNIFEIDHLEELREYLSGKSDPELLRKQLHAEFLKHSQYRNATEWNTAVRICEALAITGWGDHEPVEAVRGIYFNGAPNTYFLNRDAQPRLFDAVWSKRREGIAIDYGRSHFHDSPNAHPTASLPKEHLIGEIQAVKLCNQRNWIPKNPIRLVRGISNCYKSSKPVVESIENVLIPTLNRAMRSELYGTVINVIILNISFSFYDNYHCKTNHIIANESLKLKRKDFYPKLLEMFSRKEIEDNGYYLSNRFTYGPFRKESGTVRIEIALEKEFSQLNIQAQKQLLSNYLIHAVEQIAQRQKRKINYNFPLMISDFKSILESWYKAEL